VSANVRVFISYAHKDGSALASQLSNDLAEKGYAVWLDVARLGGGSDWSREIEREIDKADVVLALLSTGSLESDVCRGEQLRSLRRHKCVIPVLVHDNADRPVYLEARQYRDFAASVLYHQRLEELIQDIETRSSATLAPKYRETRYDTVPDLPENFVPRSAELEALKQRILSDRDQRHVALVALKGMGGIGKTVLAQALCHDESVQAAFPDGIMWVKIGEKPSDADLINQMRETAKALDKSTEGFDTLAGSSNLLRNLLKDKSVLLVLDDVWNAKHVSYFQTHGARFCRLLLTTRDADIGKATGARSHPLDVLTKELSRRLVANYAGLSEAELPGEADGIIQECDGLPLALAMVAAMLRDEPNSRWADVLDSLKKADLEEIQIQFPDYAFPSLVAAIEVSVKQLPEEVQKCYLDLAIFPEDTPIPECALAVIWGREGKEVRRIASQLVNRSLATRDPSGHLGLHDLQVDYVRNEGVRKQTGVESALALQGRFLEAYAGRCAEGWPTGPKDGYYFEHLPWHLKEAGRTTELRQLLFNFDWLQTKLEATDPYALIADYDYLQDGEELRLIQSALRLSANALARDHRQLAGQFIGRLLGNTSPSIQVLLKQAAERKVWPWFRPLKPSLTAPGGPLIRTLEGHTDPVFAVTVTPDGRRAVSASTEGTLRVWDLESGQTLRTLVGHTNDFWAAVITPDGCQAVSASDDDRTLRLWDLESGQILRTFEDHTDGVLALAVTPDGHRAVSASFDKKLRLWDLESGQIMRTFEGHTDLVLAVAVTPDGRRAVSASHDATLRVWDLESGQTLRTLEGHRTSVYAVAVTPDGRRAVSASHDATLRVWDLESGQTLCTLVGHTNSVNAVAVTRDGYRAVSASKDGTLHVWGLESGQTLCRLVGHTDDFLAVAVTPDGRRAVSGSIDGSLRLWDLESDQTLGTLEGDTDGSFWAPLAIALDGCRAVSVSLENLEKTLSVWDLENGQTLRTLEGHTDRVNAVALTPDGHRAVSGSRDGTLRAWDLESGQTLRTLEGHTDPVLAVAVTPDGRRAVSGSSDGSLRLWDLESGQTLRTLEGHTDRVNALVITPDGCRAVSASDDRTLRLWDLGTGQILRTLEGHTDSVFAVTVTPDGPRAISASDDRALRLWDLATGQTLRTLVGHTDTVLAVAVTPDGRRAVSASVDKKLRLWDLGTSQTLRTLEGHTDRVNAVAVTPDGRRAVSASGDRTLRLWDLESRKEIASFTGEDYMHSCAVTSDGRTVIGRDRSGRLHFLRIVEADETKSPIGE
jgi:WD40 repeat protein